MSVEEERARAEAEADAEAEARLRLQQRSAPAPQTNPDTVAKEKEKQFFRNMPSGPMGEEPFWGKDITSVVGRGLWQGLKAPIDLMREGGKTVEGAMKDDGMGASFAMSNPVTAAPYLAGKNPRLAANLALLGLEALPVGRAAKSVIYPLASEAVNRTVDAVKGEPNPKGVGESILENFIAQFGGLPWGLAAKGVARALPGGGKYLPNSPAEGAAAVTTLQDVGQVPNKRWSAKPSITEYAPGEPLPKVTGRAVNELVKSEAAATKAYGPTSAFDTRNPDPKVFSDMKPENIRAAIFGNEGEPILTPAGDIEFSGVALPKGATRPLKVAVERADAMQQTIGKALYADDLADLDPGASPTIPGMFDEAAIKFGVDPISNTVTKGGNRVSLPNFVARVEQSLDAGLAQVMPRETVKTGTTSTQGTRSGTTGSNTSASSTSSGTRTTRNLVTGQTTKTGTEATGKQNIRSAQTSQGTSESTSTTRRVAPNPQLQNAVDTFNVAAEKLRNPLSMQDAVMVVRNINDVLRDLKSFGNLPNQPKSYINKLALALRQIKGATHSAIAGQATKVKAAAADPTHAGTSEAARIADFDPGIIQQLSEKYGDLATFQKNAGAKVKESQKYFENAIRGGSGDQFTSASLGTNAQLAPQMVRVAGTQALRQAMGGPSSQMRALREAGRVPDEAVNTYALREGIGRLGAEKFMFHPSPPRVSGLTAAMSPQGALKYQREDMTGKLPRSLKAMDEPTVAWLTGQIKDPMLQQRFSQEMEAATDDATRANTLGKLLATDPDIAKLFKKPKNGALSEFGGYVADPQEAGKIKQTMATDVRANQGRGSLEAAKVSADLNAKSGFVSGAAPAAPLPPAGQPPLQMR